MKLSLLFQIKGEAIYSSTCFLGLTRPIENIDCLELVFTNFDRVSTYFADTGVVKLDMYHQPTVLEIPFGFHNTHSMSQHKHSYCNYAAGDYNLLYSLLCNCDRSCVYKNKNVDDCAHFEKKATVLLLAITDRFLYQTTFLKFLNLLYTAKCHITLPVN
jgi:hypothetical protein